MYPLFYLIPAVLWLALALFAGALLPDQLRDLRSGLRNAGRDVAIAAATCAIALAGAGVNAIPVLTWLQGAF